MSIGTNDTRFAVGDRLRLLDDRARLKKGAVGTIAQLAIIKHQARCVRSPTPAWRWAASPFG